jgi:hypothetical protein
MSFETGTRVHENRSFQKTGPFQWLVSLSQSVRRSVGPSVRVVGRSVGVGSVNRWVDRSVWLVASDHHTTNSCLGLGTICFILASRPLRHQDVDHMLLAWPSSFFKVPNMETQLSRLGGPSGKLGSAPKMWDSMMEFGWPRHPEHLVATIDVVVNPGGL